MIKAIKNKTKNYFLWMLPNKVVDNLAHKQIVAFKKSLSVNNIGDIQGRLTCLDQIAINKAIVNILGPGPKVSFFFFLVTGFLSIALTVSAVLYTVVYSLSGLFMSINMQMVIAFASTLLLHGYLHEYHVKPYFKKVKTHIADINKEISTIWTSQYGIPLSKAQQYFL